MATITGAEIAEVLRAVDRRELALERIDGDPADGYGLVTYRTANGWEICVFNDGWSWDYIDHVKAPDGRTLDFPEVWELPELEDLPSSKAIEEIYGFTDGPPPGPLDRKPLARTHDADMKVETKDPSEPKRYVVRPGPGPGYPVMRVPKVGEFAILSRCPSCGEDYNVAPKLSFRGPTPTADELRSKTVRVAVRAGELKVTCGRCDADVLQSAPLHPAPRP